MELYADRDEERASCSNKKSHYLCYCQRVLPPLHFNRAFSGGSTVAHMLQDIMGAFKAVAKEQGLENVPCLQRKCGIAKPWLSGGFLSYGI